MVKKDNNYNFGPTVPKGTVIVKLPACCRKKWIKWTFYDKQEGLILSAAKPLLTALSYLSVLNVVKFAYRCICRSCSNDKEQDLGFITELYVVVCLALAVIASYVFPGASLCLSQRYNGLINVLNTTVFYVWPFYRVFTFIVFMLQWIFIVRGNIKSPSRSMLLFIFNLIEMSILLTIIQATLANKIEITCQDIVNTIHSMITISQPDFRLHGWAFYIDILGFILGPALMLVIVAGLVSQLVRINAQRTGDK